MPSQDTETDYGSQCRKKNRVSSCHGCSDVGSQTNLRVERIRLRDLDPVSL